MDRQRFLLAGSVLVLVCAWAARAGADGWDPGSTASNTGSVTNTRHNMTQSFDPIRAAQMEGKRNNYGEVCVYCHTPHGASSTVAAPLWNRTTNPASSYTTYDKMLTSGQVATAPGVNSLTCLSCHDGTIAIDSVINMPGSGMYQKSQETSVDTGFLSTWVPASAGHFDLATCQAGCHNGIGAVDFQAFIIGKDLRNDHPVGVNLPDPAVYDFKAPTGSSTNLTFYDGDGDSHADPDEVRFYNTGDGPEVECASCHDPHGVPGAGGVFNPSFLRVYNGGSALCKTCHTK